MRSIIRSIAFVMLVAASALGADGGTYAGPKEKLHVYLLIGQSNMAGRAPFTKEEARPIPRCFLLNDKDTWEQASNPLNRYSTIRKGLGMQKMNPGYGFSLAMLAAEKDVSLGLVVNAKGGTKIEQWKKGTRFYAEAVRRAKEAAKSGVLKGILWHQGESNAKNPDGYLEKLAKLVADLRADLGVKDLPFVAGQVNNVPAINDQIAKLPETVTNTGFASSEGLKAMDRWHFDAKSMKLLGKRYAEAMIKLHEKSESRKNDAHAGK